MAVLKFPANKMTDRLAAARFDSIEIPELIGLCKGVLADGIINLAEAKFILQWLTERPQILEIWPADELNDLLLLVLEDGVLSDEEEDELAGLLEELVGDPVSVMIY